jgi:hypothetical protein
MKKLIIVFAIAVLAPQITQAQGTVTYLSNLGQTSDGSNPVGSDSWLAAIFATGNNSSGYMLNSVQLGITDASGNPSGFTVMIYAQNYSNLGGAFPGSSIGTLNGSLNPVTAGTYTYTDDSDIILSPSTYYFLVVTAGTAVANSAYEWSFANTASYNPTDNWLGAVTLSSSNGLSWIRLGSNPDYDFSEYAITATAIPEPSSSLLLLLGSGVFIYVRRTFNR